MINPIHILKPYICSKCTSKLVLCNKYGKEINNPDTDEIRYLRCTKCNTIFNIIWDKTYTIPYPQLNTDLNNLFINESQGNNP